MTINVINVVCKISKTILIRGKKITIFYFKYDLIKCKKNNFQKSMSQNFVSLINYYFIYFIHNYTP